MIKDVSLIRYGNRVERVAVRRDLVVLNRHPTPDDKTLLIDVVMNQITDVLYRDPSLYLKGGRYYDVEVTVKVNIRRDPLPGVGVHRPVFCVVDEWSDYERERNYEHKRFY